MNELGLVEAFLNLLEQQQHEPGLFGENASLAQLPPHILADSGIRLEELAPQELRILEDVVAEFRENGDLNSIRDAYGIGTISASEAVPTCW